MRFLAGFRAELRRFVVAVLSSLASIAVHAAITPTLSVSRSSGPAPLAVFFDASDTVTDDKSQNAFFDLGYKFAFGDPSSGNWPRFNDTRGLQIGGPLASHIFTTPGTYKVELQVRSRTGEQASVFVNIDVDDPDSVYAGVKTVCLNLANPTQACPAGGTAMTISAWPSFLPGTRYLLQRGQDYSAFGTLAANKCANCQIGSYGDGALPLISAASFSNTSANDTVNAVLYELQTPGQIVLGGTGTLLLRTKATKGVIYGNTTIYNYNRATTTKGVIAWPSQLTIHDSEFPLNRVGEYGVFGMGDQVAITGNLITDPVYHGIRLALAHKNFISRNVISGIKSDRSNVKLHASGIDAWGTKFVYSAPSPASSYNVVSSNRLGGDGGDINNWQLGLQPQNDQSAEGVEWSMAEDNIFTFNPSAPAAQRQVLLGGRNLLERGNTRFGSDMALGVGTDTHTGALLDPAWHGPFRTGEPSVRGMFEPDGVSPPAPVSLQVQ